MTKATTARVTNHCYFIEENGGVRLKWICKKKHRGKKCNRIHSLEELPSKTIWSGDWPIAFRDDLRIEMRNQLREFKRETRKWQRQQRRLQEKKAAPKFQSYLDGLRKQHQKAKPQFTFQSPVLRN